MKKRLPTFLAGMLTAALIGGLGVTALAAAGQMTITVDPISIQVNGQTFQPKDAKGNDVPVFSLNGTTYAPLRALAEAYGLTVGYDQAANMATVTDPNATPAPEATAVPDYSTWSAEEEAAYQEFKGYWTLELRQDELTRESDRDTMYLVVATITEENDSNSVAHLWNNLNDELRANYVVRLSKEYLNSFDPRDHSFIRFEYGDKWIATVSLSIGDSVGVQLHNTDDTWNTPSISVKVE